MFYRFYDSCRALFLCRVVKVWWQLYRRLKRNYSLSLSYALRKRNVAITDSIYRNTLKLMYE